MQQLLTCRTPLWSEQLSCPGSRPGIAGLLASQLPPDSLASSPGQWTASPWGSLHQCHCRCPTVWRSCCQSPRRLPCVCVYVCVCVCVCACMRVRVCTSACVREGQGESGISIPKESTGGRPETEVLTLDSVSC